MSLEPVCKFYSYNRNCKFGKKCRYLHNTVNQRSQHTSNTEQNGEALKTSDPPTPSETDFCKISFEESKHEDSVNQSNSTNLPANTFDCENSSARYQNADNDVISELPSNSNITESRKICRYFKQHGRCAFGRNCQFSHANVFDKSKVSQHEKNQVAPRFQKKEALSHSTKSKSRNLDLKGDESKRINLLGDQPDCTIDGVVKGSRHAFRGRICMYFERGYCGKGKRCTFLHLYQDRDHNNDLEEKIKPLSGQEATNYQQVIQSKDGKPQDLVKPKVKTGSNPRAYRPVSVQPHVVKLSELKREGTHKYRQFDVTYLEKRFQAMKSGSNGNGEKGSDAITMDVTFTPSDPDWPFDVSSFVLQLTLPMNYPEELMIVKVPATKQDLPESVRRCLEVCMGEWINNRQVDLTKNNKVELMVRPFFKWLDRNFEELMTEALKQLKRELTAKAAGFEFIPATQLKAKYDANQPAEDCDEDGLSSLGEEESDESSDECLDSDDRSDTCESDEEEEEKKSSLSLNLDTDRKGTELKLRYLQLKQNASSLLFERLQLIIQCIRCKQNSELTIGRERMMSVTCEKCSQSMHVQFRPTLAHQFSSVIGYLDMDNCQAFDLIFQDCTIVVSCLACGKLTKVDGMARGQMVDGWCQACNARFKFSSESVSMYQLQPSTIESDHKDHFEIARPKIKKPPKDPGIREGYPLPDFGTCRHYKQSYRWLRFPCCGKAYPCDICHDKKEDHEMTLANRMICGHCCKEQNFSATRACKSCGEHMTKVHSSHWEGGSGCRDKISMSRNDQQKYKNMNKTISNHKKKVQTGSKKKVTKLRHA